MLSKRTHKFRSFAQNKFFVPLWVLNIVFKNVRILRCVCNFFTLMKLNVYTILLWQRAIQKCQEKVSKMQNFFEIKCWKMASNWNIQKILKIFWIFIRLLLSIVWLFSRGTFIYVHTKRKDHKKVILFFGAKNDQKLINFLREL